MVAEALSLTLLIQGKKVFQNVFNFLYDVGLELKTIRGNTDVQNFHYILRYDGVIFPTLPSLEVPKADLVEAPRCTLSHLSHWSEMSFFIYNIMVCFW